MTLLVGRQLGQFQIQEEIGRGGMARVYRALDTRLKRTVALKVLAPQLALDPEFTLRFEREAQVAASLRHPNIVTIFDVGEHEELRYIAMELVRGRTLHRILQERGALGLGYAITVIGALADALDYAHSQGAVHRDIKPQNVLIDVDGRVLLTDFGIAQAPADEKGERLTRTGVFMGTPEYISPEQASSGRVDGRSDLYSLGITTYEVITGAVPFSGGTPQLIVAHVQTPPPSLRVVDPTQPPELDAVIARILAKRPEQRYQRGADLTAALRQVARRYGIAPASATEIAALTTPPDPALGLNMLRDVPRRAPVPVVPPPPPERVSRPSSARPVPASRTSDEPARPLTASQPIVSEPPRREIPWTVAVPLLGVILLLGVFLLFQSIRSDGAIRPNGATPALPSTQSTGEPLAPTAVPTAAPPATVIVAPSLEPTSAPEPSPEPQPQPQPQPQPRPTATTEPPPPDLPTAELPTVEPTQEVPSPTIEAYPPPTTEPTQAVPSPEPPTAEPTQAVPSPEPPTAELATVTPDILPTPLPAAPLPDEPTPTP